MVQEFHRRLGTQIYTSFRSFEDVAAPNAVAERRFTHILKLNGLVEVWKCGDQEISLGWTDVVRYW